MSEIKHILLVPAEGDPHGLLKDGPCGARPPMAAFWMCRDGHQEHGTWMGIAGGCPHPDHEGRLRPLRIGTGLSALVLAWDGEPVAGGCFRADTTEWHLYVELVTSIMAGERRAWSEMPKTNVGALADLGYGTIVLLDAEGQEVSDELEGSTRLHSP